jgi:hypothetical protein
LNEEKKTGLYSYAAPGTATYISTLNTNLNATCNNFKDVTEVHKRKLVNLNTFVGP